MRLHIYNPRPNQTIKTSVSKIVLGSYEVHPLDAQPFRVLNLIQNIFL